MNLQVPLAVLIPHSKVARDIGEIFQILLIRKLKVTTISTREFGESIVPGTVEYASFVDDASGNLIVVLEIYMVIFFMTKEL